MDMNIPHLTAAETEMLNHRLEMPDCICDALEESDFDLDDIAAAAEHLLDGDYPAANAYGDAIIAAVLGNAVENSTYLATADGAETCGEITKAKYLGLCRVGRSLAAKVSHAIGRTVRIPES